MKLLKILNLKLKKTKTKGVLVIKEESKKIKNVHKDVLYKLAGLAGFEPAREGVKVLCLTAWL